MDKLTSRCVMWATMLLTGCGSTPESAPAQKSPVKLPPKSAPTVLAVTRYFAGELAKGTRFIAAEAPRYADSLLYPRNSEELHLELPTCWVEAGLSTDKALEIVYIQVPHPFANRNMARPNPNRLVRLGELRRAFGPGKIDLNPGITLAQGSRKYPVAFRYQPTPGGRAVVVKAEMPIAAYADSAWVNSIDLFLP